VYFFNISNIIFYDVKQKFDVLNSNGHLILKKTKQFWGGIYDNQTRNERKTNAAKETAESNQNNINRFHIRRLSFFKKQFTIQHTHTHTHWHEKQKNYYYFLNL
jgi:adenine-specific DNA glycosylase